MATTSSSLEAKEHIAKIRRDKGLLEGSPSGHNVSDLESALTTLSDQLYQSSTHFLLELIQNADDNSYDPAVEPSVQFTYTNGYLRVDCNELGFSPRNVEALCRVGKSTKKGGDNASRYVGEKGIGFKSVFKAADVVWISSGYYSFKFDKREPLGMIAPIWDNFPAPVRAGFTSFYLQLSKDYNQRGLLDELRSLDARLLIFLRRLRSISVTISESFRKTWKSSFSRAEISQDLIRLTENNKVCDYIIRRHQVSNMPEEPKRQGVSTSEIILGFPITEENQPKRESQQAYAFLPIRDYGFEFLIQADWLLIASREDIDDSSQWNHTLRNALFPAFVAAIRGFNSGELRYVWPRYLPTQKPLQSFLEPFHLELGEKLGAQALLFSQSGDVTFGKNLKYVPEEYTFNGAPMTISARTSGWYLSGRYSKLDMKYLEVLGVVEMVHHAFFLELSSLIVNSASEFKSKSDAWHSHLATILIRFPAEYSARLAGLALIPLNNGSWVAASGRQILFPSNRPEFELPDGLELAVVSSGAASDPQRRKFFKVLGVGDLEQEPVVQHIQDLHVKDLAINNRGSAITLTRNALISQIEFLYSTEFKNPKFQRFWFTAESGQKLQGSQLYQDSSKPHSASKFFATQRTKFPFIHKDYMEAAGKDAESWVRWLEEKMDVATMPRLVTTTPTKGFVLSDDFKSILKNFSSSDVLLLLRDNWEEYSNYFDPVAAAKCAARSDMINKYDQAQFTVCADQLKQKLSSMMVTCSTGKKHRLDTTFLPTKELVVASQDDVPFLDVPDADDVRWEVFKLLGVSIKADVSFYLRCLKRLEGSSDSIRVEKLYNTIEFRCYDKTDSDQVKSFIDTKELIFIPAIGQRMTSKWVSVSRCRWKGPPVVKQSQDLKTFESLRDIYPGNKRLFCEILGVKDATLQDLVTEVKAIAVGDSLAHVTSLFQAMERLIEDDPKASTLALQGLKSRSVFPVSKKWLLELDPVSGLQNSLAKSEWFIADTAPFRTMFAGVIPLLEFKVDDLAAMDQVIEKLGLKTRFLSKQATSVPIIQGVVELNKELTDIVKSKVDFIIRLIPTLKSQRTRRQEVINQLRNLQVYTADEVIQEWSVQFKGKPVKGPQGNGHVALAAEDDVLKIYVTAKSNFRKGQIPLELVDALFNFCGMLAHNPEHSEMCLHVAVSQDDPVQIMKVFANKGIPSLESLKFADAAADEDENSDDEEGNMKEKGSNQGSKRGPFRESSFGKAILAVPFGIASGFGEFIRSRRDFEYNGDEKMRKIKGPKPPKARKRPKPRKAPKLEGSGEPSQLHKSLSKGWLRLQIACTFPPSDEEVGFKGELAIHEVLSETLNANYNPLQHWTSKRRTKAKLAAFSAEPDKHSTFTFADTSGSFTQLLIKDHFPGAKDWVTRPPTYHIDVKSTRGDIQAAFTISPAQFQRARDLSIMMQQMKGRVDSVPTEVYILARVYEVDVIVEGEAGEKKDKAKIMFLVDPWECYHADRLMLKHKGELVGSVV